MKKILAWVLLIALCLGLFAGCKKDQGNATTETTAPVSNLVSTEDLESAMEYIRTIYRSAPEKTPKDYQRIGNVPIEGVDFEVVWTVNVSEDVIKIIRNEDGMVTIDVNEAVEEDTPYVLTATITDGNGNTVTYSWNHLLPAAMDMAAILEEAYALKAGESLPYEATLTGKIISIDTMYSDDFQNITVTIVVEGHDDKPVQCYRLKGEGAKDLAVGNIITVTGTLKNYNGTIEFDAGCILDAVEKGDAVEAPTDMIQIVKDAYALAEGKTLPYVATLKGKVTEIDAPYDPSYGNISVVIEIEGIESKPILCYRLKGTGVDKIAVNDIITVQGIIKNYNGTIEFDAGSIMTDRVSGGGVAQGPSSDANKILRDAQALKEGEKLPYRATLTGEVVSVDSPYDSGYGNVTVTIKVNGVKIQCYRMKGEHAPDVRVTDKITVSGIIENYYGKLEFGSGCSLDSWEKGSRVVAINYGSLKENTPYNLAMAQNAIGKNLYFNGKASGNYLATSENAADAVDIYMEKIDGKGVRFFFMEGNTKTYVEIIPRDTDASKTYPSLTTSPSAYFTYDEDAKTYTVENAGSKFYLGTYSTFNTISTSSTYYITDGNASTVGKTQFVAEFVPSGTELPEPPAVETPEETDPDGTVLTIVQANEKGAAMAHNTYTTVKYKVTGKITEIYQTTYGNMYIADDAGNTLTIYGTYSADGADRFDAMTTKPVVGDTVTIYGVVGQYGGTAQIKNGWIVAINGVEQGGSTGGDEGGETPDEPTGEGVTISFADKANRTSYDANAQVWQQNGITVTNNKASSTNDVADYANPARFYKGSQLIIAYPNMKTIVFNVAYADRVAALTDSLSTLSGLTVTVEDLAVTVELDAPADSLTIDALANQTRISDITVYTGSGSTGGEDPDPTPDPEQPSVGVVETPEVGTAYKFGMIQEAVSTTDVYYLAGGMSGYYMASTANVANAIDVYLEPTTGGYYLYYMDGSTKTYINMVVSGDGAHVNGAYEAAASTVYTYDADMQTVVAEINDGTYRFGTRDDKTYTTIGPVDVTRGNFYCKFYVATGDAGGETPDEPIGEGVTISFADKANRTSYDANAQVWQQNGITVTNNKASSTNDVADYANPARFYKGSQLIIAYPNMKTIVFNVAYADRVAALTDSLSTLSGLTVTVEDLAVTVELDAPADSLTIDALANQTRISDITVYAGSGSTGGEDPDPTPDPEPTPEPDGTVLTIPQAIELGNAQANSAYTTEKYKITGKITSITSTTWGNLYIADEAGNEILIYGTYSADGNTRYDAMATKPVVGDTITVYGVVGNYNGTTPQMKDGWVIEHIPGESGGDEGDTDTTVVDPEVGTAYKFGMIQEAVSTTDVYYLAGGMSGYYMASTANVANAIDVYLEPTTGGYYLYYMDGSTKTYINMVVSGDGEHVNGAYEAAASTVYTYDADMQTVVAEINDGTYRFGTRDDKTYTTIGPVDVTMGNFYCKFYTMEAGGEDPDPTPDPEPDTDEMVVTNPTVGTAYNLYVNQETAGKVVYFAGGAANQPYYLATTENAQEAVDVYLEPVTGGFRMYYMDGTTTKTYIDAYLSGTYYNARLTTEPTAVYTYNSEYNTMVANIEGMDCYLGAYNSFTTISLSKYEYITGSSSYASHFAVPVEKEEEPGEDPTPTPTPDPTPSTGNYTKITSAAEFTTGKYVLVAGNGYAPTALDDPSKTSPWLLSGMPVVADNSITVENAAGYVFTVSVDGTSATLTDANGNALAPKAGNNNGIISGAYNWAWTFENGAFQFKGVDADTTMLACNSGTSGGNKFRSYKTSTVGDHSSEYLGNFTLYKLVEE